MAQRKLINSALRSNMLALTNLVSDEESILRGSIPQRRDRRQVRQEQTSCRSP